MLQSADASIWVTGRRPKGDGFDLNVENRIDTGRWLEVAGVVKEERGMAVLEATAIRVGRPPAESTPEAVVKVPVALPPPEVVFSAPTQGETDVEPDAKVRVQFSRDLREESLKGGIAVAYAGVSAPPPAFTVRYDAGRRVAEIVFAAPLSPFANVQVVAEGHDRRHRRPAAAALHAGVHRRQLSAAAAAPPARRSRRRRKARTIAIEKSAMSASSPMATPKASDRERQRQRAQADDEDVLERG